MTKVEVQMEIIKNTKCAEMDNIIYSLLYKLA